MIVLEYTIKCIWTLQVPESVRFEMFGPVKREAGERPARSRRCERGVLLPPQKQRRCMSLGESPGRRSRVMILKSEDLPVMGTV